MIYIKELGFEVQDAVELQLRGAYYGVAGRQEQMLNLQARVPFSLGTPPFCSSFS